MLSDINLGRTLCEFIQNIISEFLKVISSSYKNCKIANKDKLGVEYRFLRRSQLGFKAAVWA